MQAVLISVVLSIGLVVIPGCSSVPGPVDARLSRQFQNTIRSDLSPAATDPDYVIAGQPLRAPLQVERFYEQRQYAPLWFRNLTPRKQVTTFTRILRSVDQHGLNSDYFHYGTIENGLTELRSHEDPETQIPIVRYADIDILLTDAYLAYVADMIGMVLNPTILKSYWQYNKKSVQDLVAIADRGFKRRHFQRFLEELAPDDAAYKQLHAALERYRDIAVGGGWNQVPAGDKLEVGVTSPRVPLLRKRLFLSGDLATDNGQLYFDDELDQAVRRFQIRHGLEPDGIVGANTLEVLNKPIEWRINQIAINMERRRWTPRKSPSRLIRVNIPDYRLEVLDNDELKMDMNVVVGQRHKDWRTPQIDSAITHMILNPLWNVPPGIFAKEMLQEIREDPEYLDKQNMIVIRVRGERGVVDPSEIDWNQVDADNPDIRIVQRSGNGNALGQIKFIFPNPHAIYLHDTTAKRLFDRRLRALSHGCIRVAKPLELAGYLLQETPEWSEERFQLSLETESNYKVELSEPTAVQILYWTAWPNEQGELQFRSDIYGYDRDLARALELTPEDTARL